MTPNESPIDAAVPGATPHAPQASSAVAPNDPGATAEAPREITASPSTLPRSLRSLLLLAGVGASLGLLGWTLRIGDRFVGYALGNVMTRQGRIWAGANMAIGAALAAGLGLALMLRPRWRQGELAHRLAARAAPLALAWLLPVAFTWRLWSGHELAMMVLLAFGALCLQGLIGIALASAPVLCPGVPFTGAPARILRAARTAWAAPARARAALAGMRRLPFALVLLGVAGYALYFSLHTLQTHYRLGTQSFDLALEDNLIWNAAQGGPLFKMAPLGGPDAVHGGYHQTYFAYLIALVYRLAPGPGTLLAVQALLIGAAAIPLYFIAARRLGRWTACLVSLLYLLYPPLHGSNLYDFHYLPLGVVFVWSVLALLEAQRTVLAALATLLALSVREDVGALIAVLGALMALTGIRPRAGLVLAGVGGVTFGVLKFIVMPRWLGGGQSFVHQYRLLAPDDLHSYGGVLLTVFANPFFTVGKLLEAQKLLYLLQLFVPLAFLPLRRPIGVLCCLPGFFFTLLATEYPPLIQISFQYTAYWTTFLFPALILNLHWLRERDARALGYRAARATLVVISLACSYQYGAVLNTHNTMGGFGRYRFGLTEADQLRHHRAYLLIQQIPPDAKVVASELLTPHVSSRRDAYTLRTGLYDAEWLLFELPAGGAEAQQARSALLDQGFGVVDLEEPFVLARRGHSPRRNPEILSRL